MISLLIIGVACFLLLIGYIIVRQYKLKRLRKELTVRLRIVNQRDVIIKLMEQITFDNVIDTKLRLAYWDQLHTVFKKSENWTELSDTDMNAVESLRVRYETVRKILTK